MSTCKPFFSFLLRINIIFFPLLEPSRNNCFQTRKKEREVTFQSRPHGLKPRHSLGLPNPSISRKWIIWSFCAVCFHIKVFSRFLHCMANISIWLFFMANTPSYLYVYTTIYRSIHQWTFGLFTPLSYCE